MSNEASALLTLYDSTLLRNEVDETDKANTLRSLETEAGCIVDFASQLFGVVEDLEYQTMSPLIPYSLYQAAVVQFRLWKQSDRDAYKKGLDVLTGALAQFNKRWLIAGEQDLTSNQYL